MSPKKNEIKNENIESTESSEEKTVKQSSPTFETQNQKILSEVDLQQQQQQQELQQQQQHAVEDTSVPKKKRGRPPKKKQKSESPNKNLTNTSLPLSTIVTENHQKEQQYITTTTTTTTTESTPSGGNSNNNDNNNNGAAFSGYDSMGGMTRAVMSDNGGNAGDEELSDDEEMSHSFFPEDIKESFRTILGGLPEEMVELIAEQNQLQTKDDQQKLSIAIIIESLIDRAIKIGTRKFFNAIDKNCMIWALSIIKDAKEKGRITPKELASQLKLDHLNATAAATAAANVLASATSSTTASSSNISNTSNIPIITTTTTTTTTTGTSRKNVKTLFKETFKILGAEDFLTLLNSTLLEQFSRSLDFDDETNDHEHLVDAILEEIFLFGAKDILTKCMKELIVNCAKKLNVLNESGGATKPKLIRQILGIEFPHLIEEEEKKSHSEGKKRGRSKMIPDANRKNFEKGVTSLDLQSSYTQQELIEFSRKHGLKYGMKKNIMADNIVKYLNGDPDVERSTKKRGRPPSKHRQSASTSDFDENNEIDEE